VGKECEKRDFPRGKDKSYMGQGNSKKTLINQQNSVEIYESSSIPNPIRGKGGGRDKGRERRYFLASGAHLLGQMFQIS